MLFKKGFGILAWSEYPFGKVMVTNYGETEYIQLVFKLAEELIKSKQQIKIW